MAVKKKAKPAGRKPKNPEERVVSKGVYLTSKEWEKVESKFESGTKAMRLIVLPNCG